MDVLDEFATRVEIPRQLRKKIFTNLRYRIVKELIFRQIIYDREAEETYEEGKHESGS